MAGYRNDFSMSNNAFDAYQSGEMPKSKWTKKAIVAEIQRAMADGELDCAAVQWTLADIMSAPAASLKNYLTKSSRHHTSSWYNYTDFYSVDFDRLALASAADLLECVNPIKREAPEMWECAFLVWSGTKRHPKATETTAIGKIVGNWFFLSDGSKKSINANGFRKIKKVG